MKIFVIMLLSSLLSHSQENAWPTILRGTNMAQVKKVESKTNSHIYRGKFFQFISDSEISLNDMRRFAATAESVHYALKKIPLDLVHTPKLDPDRSTHSIFIYKDVAAYDKAVGVKFSAGYYSKSKRAVFLRKDKFIDSKEPNNPLLVHELTHLNMHGIIAYSNAWFSEGNAEYMASSFFNNGSYNFKNIKANIRNRARTFISTKNTRDGILLPSLESTLAMDDPAWIKYYTSLAPEDRYLPYLTALITVHYFYHVAPDGREKISRYIADLTSNDRKLRSTAQQDLFQGINLSQLEKSLTSYWLKNGLRIKFKD